MGADARGIRRPRRLATRFNLLSTVLILATSAGVTFLLVRMEMRAMRATLVTNAKTTAAMMAQNGEFALYTADPRALDAILESASAARDIAYAAILDGQRRVLRSRVWKEGAAIPDASAGMFPLPPGAVAHRQIRVGRGGRDIVDVVAPVVSAGTGTFPELFPVPERGRKVIGFVQIGVGAEELERETRRFIAAAALITAILVCVGAGLNFLLSRRITVPISRLVEFARSISEENLDRRIAVAGSMETQELALSLSQMLSRLKASKDQVSERTEALEAANQRMESEIRVRTHMENALNLFRMAVEQVGEALIITDPEGRILYVNPGFERITGYGPAETIGNDPRILIDLPRGRSFYRRLRVALARDGAWSGNVHLRRRSGAPFEGSAVISPIRDAAGGVVNFVTVMRDATEELRLQEQLRQSQKMEAIGSLAGGVAHDFNNLLTAISGYSDVLRAKLGEAASRHPEVDEIQKASQRAASLTRQLLAFSRKQILQPQVLDLNAVISDMEAMLRRIIGEDIDFVVAPADGLWAIRNDPTQIEQVVMNLVVNAKDAMHGPGTLTVGTGNVVLDEASVAGYPGVEPGPFVTLFVEDTGCGMDESTRDRAFEPFFTTKSKEKGTGLGLSTVYGIVKQSRGLIRVSSELGRGSTFHVFFPRVEASDHREPVLEAADGAETRGVETILVAEDEPQVRELVDAVLRERGYNVLTAGNGVEALEISARHEGAIHLLLTDVTMPQMGGRELADRLSAARPALQVLYMSGYAEDATIHRGVFEHEMALLSKPFRRTELCRRVREVLDSRPAEGARHVAS